MIIFHKLACWFWGHDYEAYTKHTNECVTCGKKAPNFVAINAMLEFEVRSFEARKIRRQHE